MNLVFIHGRSQEGKDPVALQTTWEDAFDEGLSNAGLSRPLGLKIGFPYYGDTLDTLVEQFKAPLVADVTERGAEQDDDEAAFRGEFLAEIAKSAGISDDEIEACFEGDVVQERGVMNWRWVHAILKALDQSKNIGEVALDAFTRDVFLYLTKKAVRRRIDEIVAPHVTGEPCVIVGHSLGSVVGYNVLRDTSNNVVRYITVGSPLGVKAIKSRLKTIEMPASTATWYNARDKHDVVSLYPLNQEHFAITPKVENYNEVDNKTDNQHGIIGYLPDPWVARAIHDALEE
jgi:hypothetical protein